MSPLSDRPVWQRTYGAHLALASLSLLAAVSWAAEPPPFEYPHGKFKESCETCHSAKGWKIVNINPKFDHAKFGFPLKGAHANAKCGGCHATLDFAQSNTQCASCHQDPHRGEMGVDCARCHDARSFVDRGRMVRAHQLSRFPLSGTHLAVECEGCHRPAAQGQMQFVGTSVECYSCHQAQYAAAPNHKQGGYSTQCQTCHKPVSWTSAEGFDHAARGFPLTGLHAQSCDTCHNGVFTNTSKDCYSCHQNSTPGYTNATPKHDPAGFPPAECAACHTEAARNHMTWVTTTGTHDHAAAGFPLLGNHSTAVRQCDDCHKGVYTGTSVVCASCHTTSIPGWSNAGPGAPVHNAQYFPVSQCTSCHASAAATFASWQGGTFSTHPTTFPLANGHAGPVCEDCHTGNYTTLVNSCYTCHQNSTPGYATASNPPHTPTNFGTSLAACTGCHNTVAWQPSTFRHSATPFPLTGAHLALACTDCHNASTWNVSGTGTNCYGCHAQNYTTALNPTHDPTNYPIAGCSCHSTLAWSPATGYDHTAAGFPLTGSHSLAARQCLDCHATSGYGAGATSPECYSCHANSTPGYANNDAVKHTTPNFGTTTTACIACHSAANATHASWSGGTFSAHASVTTSFALSGTHAGFACSDCHTATTTDLTQYTCSQACHNGDPRYVQHANKSCAGTTFDAAKTDAAIRACYGCHPRGTSTSPC